MSNKIPNDAEEIGFTLSIHDNGTEMFPRGSPEIPTCPRCGHPKISAAHDPDYVVDRRPPFIHMGISEREAPRDLALGVTYDRRMIASISFRNFCEKQNFSGLEFLPFTNDRGHFQFTVEEEIEFDFERRGTRFQKQCSACRNYAEVIGATPAFFKTLGKISPGFFRSDLAFGTSPNKSRLVVVNHDVKRLIEREFQWIGFNPAYRRC